MPEKSLIRLRQETQALVNGKVLTDDLMEKLNNLMLEKTARDLVLARLREVVSPWAKDSMKIFEDPATQELFLSGLDDFLESFVVNNC